MSGHGLLYPLMTLLSSPRRKLIPGRAAKFRLKAGKIARPRPFRGHHGGAMTTTDTNLEDVLLLERELWAGGPPHALFKELRGQCPVHWTREISEFPEEGGFWSVTSADDIHTVSRDWQTYSSELGGVTVISAIFPLELTRAMFIGMDPPKHDRVKALFQAGFTPKRIAAHEGAIREIVRKTLDGLAGRETCDLVGDVAQPVVSRVIGSFMGIPEEDDATWARLMNSTLGAGDPDLNPEGGE